MAPEGFALQDLIDTQVIDVPTKLRDVNHPLQDVMVRHRRESLQHPQAATQMA
jgi:hypothetical protein